MTFSYLYEVKKWENSTVEFQPKFFNVKVSLILCVFWFLINLWFFFLNFFNFFPLFILYICVCMCVMNDLLLSQNTIEWILFNDIKKILNVSKNSSTCADSQFSKSNRTSWHWYFTKTDFSLWQMNFMVSCLVTMN